MHASGQHRRKKYRTDGTASVKYHKRQRRYGCHGKDHAGTKHRVAKISAIQPGGYRNTDDTEKGHGNACQKL